MVTSRTASDLAEPATAARTTALHGEVLADHRLRRRPAVRRRGRGCFQHWRSPTASISSHRPQIRFFEKVRSVSALSTFLATDHRATRFSFLWRSTRACCVSPLLRCQPRGGDFLLAHGLFPLRFFVGSVTVIGPRRRIFTELLTDHVFDDVTGMCFLPL